MRTRAVAATVGLFGLLLAQAACGDSTENIPDAAPSPATQSEPGRESPAPGTDPILDGERQFSFELADRPNILVIDEEGRLAPGDQNAEWTRFVLMPDRAGRHQIRTAESDDSGEPYCLGIDAGSSPLTVVAAACDASRDGQLFTVEPTGAVDGGEAYAISSQGAYLQLTSAMEVIAEESDDASAGSQFRFIDQGEAPPGPGQ